MNRHKTSQIHVAFITDNNFVIPTSVAIYSIIESKNPATRLCIHIVCASLSDENQAAFNSFSTDTVEIKLIIQDAGRFSALHQVVKCNASQAALLKFVLPELLPDCSRVLYLDGDILVKRDLTELYNTELEDNYVACVLNSFTFYRKHFSFEDKVENYFNSGVMVLNLKLMRKDNITEKLIETKAKMGYELMDQIALNYVFDKRIYLLPVRYNYQILSLPGTNNDKEIQTLNKHYGTQYSNLEDLLADTVIVHFAAREKPWNTPTTPLSEEWYLTYLRSPVSEKLPPLSWLFQVELEREIKEIRNSRAYRVGYIITWLPNKIFAGIYSLKHNGLI